MLNNFQKASDEKVFILEFGAGSGILAVDVLLELEKLGSLPEKYLILELSAELKQRQRETVSKKSPHLLDYVQWLDQLPEDAPNTIVIANEVLDAMPVECFKVNDTGSGNKIESLMIGLEKNKLVSRYMPADRKSVV